MKKSYFNEFDKLEKNISINILIWVFIFLILLFSLILIFESPLLSILGFLTVLISIPPTGKLINNFFQSKYNFTINKKLKLIICFLSFFLLMNSIPKNIKQEEDKNLNEATPKTTAPQKILGLMPVDIYLNDKLFKKGYPNNTYFIFYPEVHKLPRGSNKLLIVDPRPGNQNITQSKTQLIEFRVEPNEELIVYNVVPNRIIR